jgi:hypothetical protein
VRVLEHKRERQLAVGPNATWCFEDRLTIQYFAVADEDLERENAEKTSTVHFLRFELAVAMIGGLRTGGALALGIDHDNHRHQVSVVPADVRAALIADLSQHSAQPSAVIRSRAVRSRRASCAHLRISISISMGDSRSG